MRPWLMPLVWLSLGLVVWVLKRAVEVCGAVRVRMPRVSTRASGRCTVDLCARRRADVFETFARKTKVGEWLFRGMHAARLFEACANSAPRATGVHASRGPTPAAASASATASADIARQRRPPAVPAVVLSLDVRTAFRLRLLPYLPAFTTASAFGRHQPFRGC